MASKTLVGGTAYEIAGGKTMVGGTVYSIDKGKTMVGGAVYEIDLKSTVTVNIIGTFNTYSYVSIDGTQYKSDTTLEVEPGTSYTARADVLKEEYSEDCSVWLNGEKVKTGSGVSGAGYSSVVPDCNIMNFEYQFESPGAAIYITTE